VEIGQRKKRRFLSRGQIHSSGTVVLVQKDPAWELDLGRAGCAKGSSDSSRCTLCSGTQGHVASVAHRRQAQRGPTAV
jgi:hypothetical protein